MQNILKKVISIICILCLLNGQMSAAGIDDGIQIPFSSINAYYAKKNEHADYKNGYYDIYYEYFNNFKDPVVGSGEYTGIFRVNDNEKYFLYDKWAAKEIKFIACANLKNYQENFFRYKTTEYLNDLEQFDRVYNAITTGIRKTYDYSKFDKIISNYIQKKINETQLKEEITKAITDMLNGVVEDFNNNDKNFVKPIINKVIPILVGFVYNKLVSSIGKQVGKQVKQLATTLLNKLVKNGAKTVQMTIYGTLGSALVLNWSSNQIAKAIETLDYDIDKKASGELWEYVKSKCTDENFLKQKEHNFLRIESRSYEYARKFGVVKSGLYNIYPVSYLKYIDKDNSFKKYFMLRDTQGNYSTAKNAFTANHGLDMMDKDNLYQRYSSHYSNDDYGISGSHQIILNSPGHKSIPSHYLSTYSAVYNEHPQAINLDVQNFELSLSLLAASNLAKAYFVFDNKYIKIKNKNLEIINKWEEELKTKGYTEYITPKSVNDLATKLNNGKPICLVRKDDPKAVNKKTFTCDSNTEDFKVNRMYYFKMLNRLYKILPKGN